MVVKRVFSLVALIFVLFWSANPVFAQHEAEAAHHEAVEHGHDDHGDAKEEKGFDASKVIFSHIADSHYWHLFDWNEHPVSLSLPVIIYNKGNGVEFFSASQFHHGHHPYKGKYDTYELHSGMKEKIVALNGSTIYDLSLTKNVISMLISVILLIVIMTNVGKKYKKNGAMVAPTGFQNALEPIIEFIRDEVAKPNLGRHYLRFMPLILTVFFFIWINNLLGLLPGGANFTGNIAVTACLALVTFVVMMAVSNKHYWGHLLNPPGVPLGIKFLLVPIEIMSMFIKPIALCIRLFANMMAGHIVILSVISMIFIFGAISAVAGWGFAPVSLAFSIFMFCLELLVAAIQAFIFANLTAVFIGQAIEEPHGDHAH